MHRPRTLAVVFLFLSSGYALITCAADVYYRTSEGYYGASAGVTRADVSADPVTIEDPATGAVITGQEDNDHSGLAWSIFAGYKLNSYFGIELGYADLGNISRVTTFTNSVVLSTETNASTSGFNVKGLVNIPLARRLDVFGKVGAYNWSYEEDQTITQSGGSTTESFEDDGTDIMFGVGAKYRFTNGFSIRFDWDRYKNIAPLEVNKFSLGLEYNFEI